MEQSLILALDIGTSSVRASLYDSGANPIPRASIKIGHEFAATPDGGSEIDADAAFLTVVSAIDALLEKTQSLKGEIGYVASSAFWHSLVGIDEKGKPTTMVLGWADTRARKHTSLLRSNFDETAVHNRTGARFHSSYWPAKLMWLRKERPGVFGRTARWMSFSDLVALRLFGKDTTSVSMASGTGIFDIRKCTWDGELLRFLKIRPSALPPIAESDEATFTLNRNFMKRWARLAGAEWFPAIGDGAADNIGSGCVTRSRAALMVGTSGAMRVAYTGEPPSKIPDGLWCYRVDRKRVIIGGALSDGGALYRWLRDTLDLPKGAEARIADQLPGDHGLTFLPFLAGERGTGYNESAAGAIVGLTTAHQPIDILQAALESVAFRFAEIFDQLNKITRIKEIAVSGGALRDSPVWSQIIADVLGRDLVLNNTQESSSRGAVLHMLESMGKLGNIETNVVADKRSITRDRNRFETYRKMRKRHAEIYKLLIR